MNKHTLASLTLGSVLVMAQGTAAYAGENPFAHQPLKAGYQLAQADKKVDGKCGEAKCGAEKRAADKKPEGKCGEAKCGASKAEKKAEGKQRDGKCGEAKCGASK